MLPSTKSFLSSSILSTLVLHSNAFCALPTCNFKRSATLNQRLPTAVMQRGYCNAVTTTPTTVLSATASSSTSAPKAATSIKDETLSGLVVALASIPMSIAFANIAGVSPLVGIWSSVVLGLVSALVGGSPGLIAGSAGVVVVPLAPLLAAHGTGAMAPCVFLAAGVQLLCGVSQVGKKAMRLVDDNVMKGFLNGLGLLLAQSQLTFFTTLAGVPLAAALGLAGVTVATMTWLPKLTRAVPPALAGVAAATVIASLLPAVAPSWAASCQVATLAGVAAAGGGADAMNTFAGGWRVLPTPLDVHALAAAPLSLWQACVPAAMSVAAIAVLETLLAAKVAAGSKGAAMPAAATADGSSNLPTEEDGESKSGASRVGDENSVTGSDSVVAGGSEQSEDRVLLGLGLGNAVSALCGGFGGCGLIPQTVLNGQAGGRTRLSSGAYAVAMALSVVCFAPVIGAIPVASLSGLMLTVAAATVQVPYSKQVLKEALKKPRKQQHEQQQQEQQPEQTSVVASLGAQSKLAVLACTSVTCFFIDMAAGIGVGVVLTKLLAKFPSSNKKPPEVAL